MLSLGDSGHKGTTALRNKWTDKNGIIGNELANVITGNDGDNYINGGAGTDLMIGGAGNDTYSVDNLLDIVQEEAGGGDDVVYSTQDIQLFGHIETLILIGDAVAGFGDDTNNQLFGNDGDNVLYGRGGVDYMEGGAGDDIFVITPENGVFDVIGDFTDGSDRIGLSGFGSYADGARVFQVSSTSYEVRSADQSIVQTFVLQNYAGDVLDTGDYYFA